MGTGRETRRADLVRPRGEPNLLPLRETTAAALAAAASITYGQVDACARSFVRWSGGNSGTEGTGQGEEALEIKIPRWRGGRGRSSGTGG